VVVNNRSTAAAEEVVEEIRVAGGEAICAIGDVTLDSGVAALIDVALGAYGRIDALVNNAGIAATPGPFAATPLTELRTMLAVHVEAPWRLTQAAWPHFVERGYGRVLFVSSTAVFGHPTQTAYATAKSALTGFARCLSLEGAPHGIRVNAVMPTARTRLSAPRTEANAVFWDWAADNMTVDHVAPLVAALVHDDCPVSGEIINAGAGQFQLAPTALTQGLALAGGELDPETVLARFSEIVDLRSSEPVKAALDLVARLPVPPG
jgi:NAD(P)-dependent dehydrogenase (short-subunit alcohol dehydrogenase family)